MQFKPGNILNEYEKDDREGFKDNWLSSYIIVTNDETTDLSGKSYVIAACLFDVTNMNGDQKPGLKVHISKDIDTKPGNYPTGSDEELIYWQEVEIAG